MSRRDGGTLADIARRAGVSKMTVSRALRMPEKVAESTREKILRAVRDSGFVPSRLASGLAGGRTGLVAAIVPTTTTTMFTAAIRGLDHALSAGQQALVIGQSEYRKENEERLVRAYLAWRPDGLILTGGSHTPSLETLLRRTGLPVAEMWTLRPDPIGAAIGFSDRAAFLELTRRLVATGYRRPGFIARDTLGDPRVTERLSGYRAVLAEAGLAPRVVLQPGAQPAIQAGPHGDVAAHPVVAGAGHQQDGRAAGDGLVEAHVQQGAAAVRGGRAEAVGDPGGPLR
jgi:LacI family gluconate utilization system Gnt-I transcriptional repressor